MRILSVNIEGSRHLDTVSRLLDEYDPDVVCVQELFGRDRALLDDRFTHVELSGMSIQSWDDEAPDVQHIAIAAREPFEAFERRYAGPTEPEEYARFDESTVRRAILGARIGGILIATTHMMVTREASIEPWQFDDVGSIIGILEPFERVVLCGDFNATRGEPVFDALAGTFTDTIPADARSTLDPEMHKARPKQLVVDGCFTRDVNVSCALRFGVSDHAALLIETRE